MEKKVQWKAPFTLGQAIQKAKTQKKLKPLLQIYSIIYGSIPDVLCKKYQSLPAGRR